MKKNIAFLLLITACFACTKDKFKTEPQVEIESFTPEAVQKGQNFTLTALVRDKEGDLQDSLLVVKKRFSGVNVLTVDTVRYFLGQLSFPDKQQIEMEIVFAYGEFRDGTIYQALEQVDRGFAVGLIARDKAGNKSEYVESERITLKKL